MTNDPEPLEPPIMHTPTNPVRNRPSSTRRALVLLAMAATLAACGNGGPTTPSAGAGGGGTATAGAIKVTDAWTRVTVAAQKNGAAYFVIQNDGDTDRLLKAKVDPAVAGRAEIHETTGGQPGGAMPGHSMPGGSMPGHESNGATTTAGGGAGSSAPAMAMREVPAVDVPARGKVDFKPGGYHVMLMELKQPIGKDAKIPLTLTFERAGEVKVEAVGRER